MSVQEVFATNMRHYRKAAHLTQEALAAKAGLHRTYIGGIEQRRVNVSLKNIGKIADALKVDPALLFMKTPEGRPLPRAAREAGGGPADEYALVSWSGDDVTVRPLDGQYDDLTIQVLLDLIERGYSGDRLLCAFEHARGEILSFLRRQRERP